MRSAVSPEGLRIDGRRPLELRTVSCRVGGGPGDGNAHVRHGNTHVVATVHGPRELSKKSASVLLQSAERAVMSCEYTMAPFSTVDRKTPLKRDRRAIEIGMLLKRTFESVVQLERFPHSQIDVYVTVLVADGGTRCAAINAVTLALVDAGIPMKDLVVACAAGKVDGFTLLDLNFSEDSRGLDLPVAVLAGSRKVVMCQMDSKLPLADFEPVLAVATEGAVQIATEMRRALAQRAQMLHNAAPPLGPASGVAKNADAMDEDD